MTGRLLFARRRATALGWWPLLGLLAGCSSFSPDGGFGAVAQAAKTHLGRDVDWIRNDDQREARDRRVAELLARPLSVDDAVQLALLNNRGLQAQFAELGITEADWVQAGRLPNPAFSFARLDRAGEIELERGLHIDLGRLIAMPLRRVVQGRRLQRTQAEATQAMLALAAATRKAYYQAVSADETVHYRTQVQQASGAAAELASRLQQVGNINPLQRARQQTFHTEATLQLARALQAQRASRERLTRLLGLWGDQTLFRLPDRLPDLPKAIEPVPDIERTAMARRLDVQAARQRAEQTAVDLGLTRRTRLVNVLELGIARNGSNQAPTQTGWEIGVELPLFDWGDARVARAEAIYMQAVERAAETAIHARSEVREAYGAYRTAFDIATLHRDELVPLRQRIADENVLRYNGMLIGVFDLLADARLQISSVNAYIEALRDFWMAQADLDMALLGRASPGPSAEAAASPAADAGGAGH